VMFRNTQREKERELDRLRIIIIMLGRPKIYVVLYWKLIDCGEVVVL
jgi:hypothetical protein